MARTGKAALAPPPSPAPALPQLALDEVDLSSRDFWAGPPELRDAAFAVLRRERPVARFAEPDLRDRSPLFPAPGAYWAVTRHAHIAEVSRRPDVYSSAQGAISIIDLPPELVEYFGGMISTDNPRHARLRRIVGTAFSPRMIARLEDRVAAVASQIVASVAQRGSCDFVTDIATPFPLQIICDLMGIPAGEHERVLRCATVIASEADEDIVPTDVDPAVAFLEAGQELTALMEAIGEERLAHPSDDLTTALITSNVDGEALTRSELAAFFILLVVAGSETTRNAVSHALVALDRHPDQRARWRADPEALSQSAADEVVRWATPVTWMRRTAAERTVLGGQEIEPGDKVVVYYCSANRDEAVFPDPFTFDVARTPNPHMGFGSAGPHFCLGAHLARREIGAMWKELLSRLPDIHATAEPDRLRSSFVNGIKHLPCAWTPA